MLFMQQMKQMKQSNNSNTYKYLIRHRNIDHPVRVCVFEWRKLEGSVCLAKASLAVRASVGDERYATGERGNSTVFQSMEMSAIKSRIQSPSQRANGGMRTLCSSL